MPVRDGLFINVLVLFVSHTWSSVASGTESTTPDAAKWPFSVCVFVI